MRTLLRHRLVDDVPVRGAPPSFSGRAIHPRQSSRARGANHAARRPRYEQSPGRVPVRVAQPAPARPVPATVTLRGHRSTTSSSRRTPLGRRRKPRRAPPSIPARPLTLRVFAGGCRGRVPGPLWWDTFDPTATSGSLQDDCACKIVEARYNTVRCMTTGCTRGSSRGPSRLPRQIAPSVGQVIETPRLPGSSAA